MWDLDELIRRNNEAALQYMMQGQKSEATIGAKPPGGWALTVLAGKLRAGPPSLAALISYFGNYRGLRQFAALVRRLMPEYEKEIMDTPLTQRVYRFGECFAQKYYPLPLNTNCSLGDLVQHMPVDIYGLSYEEYHNLRMRPGYLLLLSLVVYPFEGDERDEEDDEVPYDPSDLPGRGGEKWKPRASDIEWVKNFIASLAINGEWIAPIGFRIIKRGDNHIELVGSTNSEDSKETIRRTLMIAKIAGIQATYRKGRTAEEKLAGARLALLDKVGGIVGCQVADRIPAAGWTGEELHQLTDKTRFDGVGDFADWACKQTGCICLDYDYEQGEYIEGNSKPVFQWTESNVRTLTEQYPRVREIRRKIDHLVEWLEVDPLNNFRDLLTFLLEKIPSGKRQPVKRRERVYIPLDQDCGDDTGDESEEREDDRILISE